jgi:putative oxidoreductase
VSSPVRLLARPLLAAIFVKSGVSQLRDLKPIEGAAEAAGFPNPKLAAQLHAGGNLVGGLALATGRAPRLAALGLAINLVPTTYVGHAFWKADADSKQLQQAMFLKNLSILGGLLIAVADTGGRESIPHRVGRVSGRTAKKAEKVSRRAAKRAGELPGQAVDLLPL